MKRLVRKDGYRYTQSADVNIEDRIIARSLVLADTANESDWKLITEEEALAIQTEQEELLNASRITERNN